MNGEVVVLFGAPVVIGVAAGYAVGGTLGGLIATRLRRVRLLLAAGALQVAQLSTTALHDQAGRVLRLPLLAVTIAIALCWAIINLADRPVAIRAACGAAVMGGLLNGVAIAANGRMPYAPAAAAIAGLPAGSATAKNVAAGHGSNLTWLGDVIPIPALHAVISAGDLLIAAGIVVLIAAAMGQLPRTSRSGPVLIPPAAPDHPRPLKEVT